MDLQNKQKLHIAMFPWLAYGHIMPFFQVAMFLAEKGHHVSYISTPKNIDRLPQIPTNLSSRLSYIQLPLPQLDGLPEGAESTAELPIHKVPYLKKAYDLLQLPLTNFLQDSRVNWIIHDFISHWLPPVAAQFGVNSVFFSIYSAATLCFLGPPSDLIAGRRQKPEDFTVVPEWIDFQSNLAFKPYETGPVAPDLVRQRLLSHQIWCDSKPRMGARCCPAMGARAPCPLPAIVDRMPVRDGAAADEG